MIVSAGTFPSSSADTAGAMRIARVGPRDDPDACGHLLLLEEEVLATHSRRVTAASDESESTAGADGGHSRSHAALAQ